MAKYPGIRVDEEVEIPDDVETYIRERYREGAEANLEDVLCGFSDAVTVYKTRVDIFEHDAATKKILLRERHRRQFERYVAVLRELRNDLEDAGYRLRFASRDALAKRVLEVAGEEGTTYNAAGRGSPGAGKQLNASGMAEALARTLEDLIEDRAQIDPRLHKRQAKLGLVYDIRAFVHQHLQEKAGLETLVQMALELAEGPSKAERPVRYYIEEQAKLGPGWSDLYWRRLQ